MQHDRYPGQRAGPPACRHEQRSDPADGERLDTPSDKLALYEAVAQNESARLEQGEDVLAQIARDLVAIIRRDVRTDWTVRDDVRAKLRSSIKRSLVQYGYPRNK